MQGWIKLTDLVWPEDYVVLHGAVCAVIHLNKDGALYEEPVVAVFDMERGFFVAEDNVGFHVINSVSSLGEIWFYILPDIKELKVSIGELLGKIVS